MVRALFFGSKPIFLSFWGKIFETKTKFLKLCACENVSMLACSPGKWVHSSLLLVNRGENVCEGGLWVCCPQFLQDCVEMVTLPLKALVSHCRIVWKESPGVVLACTLAEQAWNRVAVSRWCCFCLAGLAKHQHDAMSYHMFLTRNVL